MKGIYVIVSLYLLSLLYKRIALIVTPREVRPYQFTAQETQDYHTTTQFALEDLKKHLRDEFFGAADSILDMGCGDGQVTAYIAQKYPHCFVHGIDASSEMVKFAIQHYTTPALSNLSFAEDNICELDGTEQFDRVVSFSCFHWISNQQKAFDALYRASLSQAAKHSLWQPLLHQKIISHVVVDQLFSPVDGCPIF